MLLLLPLFVEFEIKAREEEREQTLAVREESFVVGASLIVKESALFFLASLYTIIYYIFFVGFLHRRGLQVMSRTNLANPKYINFEEKAKEYERRIDVLTFCLEEKVLENANLVKKYL